MNVVIKRIKNKTAREIGAEGAVEKRRAAWSLELTSETFEDDLTYVFGRNVEKARRENKRITGSRDGVAA